MGKELKEFLFWLGIVIGCCVVAGLLIKAAIGEPRERVTIKNQQHTYRVMDINRPKHFSVDLYDNTSGNYLKNVARRKHCNVWRKWSVGDHVVLNTVYWQYADDPNTTYIKVPAAAKLFCG